MHTVPVPQRFGRIPEARSLCIAIPTVETMEVTGKIFPEAIRLLHAPRSLPAKEVLKLVLPWHLQARDEVLQQPERAPRQPRAAITPLRLLPEEVAFASEMSQPDKQEAIRMKELAVQEIRLQHVKEMWNKVTTPLCLVANLAFHPPVGMLVKQHPTLKAEHVPHLRHKTHRNDLLPRQVDPVQEKALHLLDPRHGKVHLLPAVQRRPDLLLPAQAETDGVLPAREEEDLSSHHLS